LQKAGVVESQLAKLRPLQGRNFGSADELYAALEHALGQQWFEWWSRELIEPHGIGPWRPFHAKKGPIDTYEASGSRGQYIVIVPKASLVAVRQVESREQHAPEHDYANFTARVQALAALLEPLRHSE
jgi:hypothetical protein